MSACPSRPNQNPLRLKDGDGERITIPYRTGPKRTSLFYHTLSPSISVTIPPPSYHSLTPPSHTLSLSTLLPPHYIFHFPFFLHCKRNTSVYTTYPMEGLITATRTRQRPEKRCYVLLILSCCYLTSPHIISSHRFSVFMITERGFYLSFWFAGLLVWFGFKKVVGRL